MSKNLSKYISFLIILINQVVYVVLRTGLVKKLPKATINKKRSIIKLLC